MDIAELIDLLRKMQSDEPESLEQKKVFNVQVNIPIEAQSKEEAVELFMEQLQEIYLHIEPCDLTVKEENNNECNTI